MATILVLVAPHDKLFKRHQLIYKLGKRWKAAGHRFIVHVGCENLPAADLAILHVDLSVVPQPYLDALKPFPAVVNGTVADIRKRSYSKLVLRPDDPWSGPVIVKSDLNSGGRPELARWRLERNLGRDPGPLVVATEDDYPVLANLQQVPERIWNHSGAVVEKFVPERRGEDFCIRQCFFLGDAEWHLLVRSKHANVKGENAHQVEAAPPREDVREELRALRKEMGFAYGKFDYVLHQDRVVLFDANRTPAHFLLVKFGLFDEVTARLAAGLDGLLGAKMGRAPC